MHSSALLLDLLTLISVLVSGRAVAVPVALTFLIITTCTMMVFWSVRTQELRAAKLSSAAASGRDQKRVFVKCLLYIGAFVFVWIPVTLIHFVRLPWNNSIGLRS